MIEGRTPVDASHLGLSQPWALVPHLVFFAGFVGAAVVQEFFKAPINNEGVNESEKQKAIKIL